jgi:hypothetical protein
MDIDKNKFDCLKSQQDFITRLFKDKTDGYPRTLTIENYTEYYWLQKFINGYDFDEKIRITNLHRIIEDLRYELKELEGEQE